MEPSASYKQYVVLDFGLWSVVVSKDKISFLGPVLGLEGPVLGTGLGLEVQVLDPVLWLCRCSPRSFPPP